jgi:hypothetical protein
MAVVYEGVEVVRKVGIEILTSGFDASDRFP